MSSTVRVGKRTFTTDAICEQMSNSELLPQLLREMIIDEILAEWEIEIDGKIPYNREEFTEGCDRLSQITEYKGLNQLQLYKIVDRHLKLQKFKQARWANQVYSYYLKRKSVLDRVEFSIIQVDDLGLAKELFFRAQRGEQAFAEIAFQYSQGETAKDGGRISATDIERTFPDIATYLLGLKKDEISPIFTLDGLYTFVRLERYAFAELDDNLNRVLLDELFENWIQQQISTKLGLFAIEDAADIPESIVSSDFASEPFAILPPELSEDRTSEPELIEPTVSFFFPKVAPHNDSIDRQKFNNSDSFYTPKVPQMTLDSIDKTSTEREFPKQLDLAQVCIYGLTILSAGIFLFLPFFNLLNPSPWQRSMGAIHGFGSLLATVVAVYAGHLAFPLLRGSAKILPQVRTLTFWATSIAFLAIASGNWAYMRYRADASFGGARAWLKENSPLAQYVLMEYHEFSVLFTLPIGVACTWILWTYGDAILEKKHRVVLSATCVALMSLMFFAMGGLVTGLGIAKIHAL